MMSDDKLKPLREQIDAIDAQILDLLNRRARVAQEVGHVKAETNAPVFRPEREAQVLRKVADTPEFKEYMTKGALKPAFLTGAEYAKWVEGAEQLHRDLMTKGGLLKK